MHNSDVLRNAEILCALDKIIYHYKERGLFDKYKHELEFLALYHVYISASCRILQTVRKHALLKEFKKYMAKYFPNYSSNRYLSTLNRNNIIILKLLDKNMYSLIFIIFKAKKLLRAVYVR